MTEVKILSGNNIIGGNFVKITDGDDVLVFDQGIRFDIFGKYFSNWVQPKGIMELRRLGVLPGEEWYKDGKHVYITHLHLDHLGALSNVPSGVQVHLPGTPIYSEMKKRWENSPTWMNLIPENYYLDVKDVQAVSEDENRVMAIPVSHSAYPAFAYLYFGKSRTILYTGDMRVRGFVEGKDFKGIHKAPPLLEYLQSQHDLKIDSLIIEESNLGSERTPILPSHAISLIEKIIAPADLVIVTSHHLDVEFLVTVLGLVKKLDFKTFVTSETVAKGIRATGVPSEFKVLEESAETPLFHTAPLEVVLKDKSIVIASYYEIIDLFRSLEEANLRSKRVVYILTEPEPAAEEMQQYETVNRWLSMFGIQSYRLRVSGHYYPFEFEEILKTIKPKEIIPIHTFRADLMLRLAKAYMKK
ncbi:MAG: MBL fold metallo-hydrolase [Conexivisphaerales archaeon]